MSEKYINDYIAVTFDHHSPKGLDHKSWVSELALRRKEALTYHHSYMRWILLQIQYLIPALWSSFWAGYHDQTMRQRGFGGEYISGGSYGVWSWHWSLMYVVGTAAGLVRLPYDVPARIKYDHYYRQSE